MQMEAVIKKTVCRAEGYFDINPKFFETKGCYGCSFFNVCLIARQKKDEEAIQREINAVLNEMESA